MSKEIGIRELKIHVSEMVRAATDTRARFVITQRGKPAALAESSNKTGDNVWERLEQLGQEIARDWKNEKSAVEILSEMRW